MTAQRHSSSMRLRLPASSGQVPEHRREAMVCHAPASRRRRTVSSVMVLRAGPGHVLERARTASESGAVAVGGGQEVGPAACARAWARAAGSSERGGRPPADDANTPSWNTLGGSRGRRVDGGGACMLSSFGNEAGVSEVAEAARYSSSLWTAMSVAWERGRAAARPATYSSIGCRRASASNSKSLSSALLPSVISGPSPDVLVELVVLSSDDGRSALSRKATRRPPAGRRVS